MATTCVAAVFPTVAAVTLTTNAGQLRLQLANVSEEDLADITIVGDMDARDLYTVANHQGIKKLDLSKVNILPLRTARPVYLDLSYFVGNSIPAYVFFASEIEEITLPKDVATIEEGAFSGSRLVTLTAGEKLVSIGTAAFQDCQDLQKVELQNTKLERIGDYAFYSASNLSEITLPTSIKEVGKLAFAKTALHALTLPTTAHLGDYALSGNPELESPSGSTSLGEGVYFGDHKLQSIDALTNIPAYTYAECGELGADGIMIDASQLGDLSFAGINGKFVKFTDKLTSLGNDVFSGISNNYYFDVLALEDRIPSATEHSFRGVNQEEKELVVSGEHIELWKNDPVWGKFKVVADEPQGIEGIESQSLNVKVDGGLIIITADEPVIEATIFNAEGKTLVHQTGHDRIMTLEAPGAGGVMILATRTATEALTVKLFMAN